MYVVPAAPSITGIVAPERTAAERYENLAETYCLAFSLVIFNAGSMTGSRSILIGRL